MAFLFAWAQIGHNHYDTGHQETKTMTDQLFFSILLNSASLNIPFNLLLLASRTWAQAHHISSSLLLTPYHLLTLFFFLLLGLVVQVTLTPTPTCPHPQKDHQIRTFELGHGFGFRNL
jgi:hypothetical protein